jgi:serine phosphatase RsbU (regulator of sigma subunit)
MPLSQLLTKSKYLDAASVGAGADKANYLNVSATHGHVEDEDEDEDEDNEPLGLRVSRFISSQSQLGNADDEDDDDRPLGLHPEQQRRTQYGMFLQQHQQQQQQQQQLLLQAQIQQSMMFSQPSMIGSAFFGAPVMPQMMPMMPPPVPASPPPGAPDMTKFGRVDRWRHEIVGGQP